jgi:hypothetical protein
VPRKGFPQFPPLLELDTRVEPYIDFQVVKSSRAIVGGKPETASRRQSSDKIHSLSPEVRKRYVLASNAIANARTRVDLKKREHGPNQYGRKGTETCAQCRRRNSKV